MIELELWRQRTHLNFPAVTTMLFLRGGFGFFILFHRDFSHLALRAAAFVKEEELSIPYIRLVNLVTSPTAVPHVLSRTTTNALLRAYSLHSCV